jgi:FO synthase
MSIQAPPNLSPGVLPQLINAGINDWGGVSPITIDWVNPEAPWPHLSHLEEVTVAAGFELRRRLPVYPEFISDRWIDPGLMPRLQSMVDDRGYALAGEGAHP